MARVLHTSNKFVSEQPPLIRENLLSRAIFVFRKYKSVAVEKHSERVNYSDCFFALIFFILHNVCIFIISLKNCAELISSNY